MSTWMCVVGNDKVQSFRDNGATWGCVVEYETLIITKIVSLPMRWTVKKSSLSWTSVATYGCVTGNGEVLSVGDNVLTEETTLLLQASQDPYGKRKWTHDKPRNWSEAKSSDTPYQKVPLLVDITHCLISFQP